MTNCRKCQAEVPERYLYCDQCLIQKGDEVIVTAEPFFMGVAGSTDWKRKYPDEPIDESGMVVYDMSHLIGQKGVVRDYLPVIGLDERKYEGGGWYYLTFHDKQAARYPRGLTGFTIDQIEKT